MIALGLLAYNEEKNILEIIQKNFEKFNQVIVVEDCSTDNTLKILNEAKLNYKNLVVLNNETNLGAGKSFEKLVNFFLSSKNLYLVKADGDNQFDTQDIDELKNLLEKHNLDFIKCNRFWEGGVIGEIPKVRYFGNLFASVLVKFATGNPFLNDPLNGLMAFSKKSLTGFKLGKRFYRYGYPFYVCMFISRKLYFDKLRYTIFKNKVSYFENKKSIRPLPMFVRLFRESFKNYFSKMKLKIRLSDLQTSFLLDVIAMFVLLLSYFCIYKLIRIRYWNYLGSQTIWFAIFILFLSIWVLLLYKSFEIEKKFYYKNLYEIE